jgi:hypothetical protein
MGLNMAELFDIWSVRRLLTYNVVTINGRRYWLPEDCSSLSKIVAVQCEEDVTTESKARK